MATGSLLIKEAFEEAEAQGSCLHPSSEAMGRQLRRMRKRGDVVSPQPGLFARADYWNQQNEITRALHEIRSLSKLHPDWVFSGASAAIVHGLEVSYRYVHPLHIATTEQSHRVTAHALHRDFLAKLECEEVSGIKVTPALRSTVDCVRSMTFRYGVAVSDSYLRHAETTPEEALERIEKEYGALKGIARVRETFAIADGRAESGGESVARAAMAELGYTIPQLQVEVPNPVDGGSFRLDFMWELPGGVKVDGELDGHEKYVNPEMTDGKDALKVLADERIRESRITALGFRVMRFSMADVWNEKKFRKILDTFGIPRVGSGTVNVGR